MDTAVLKSRGVGQQIDDRLPLHEWLGSIGADDVFRTELPGAQRAAILVSEVQDEAAEERLRNWQLATALNHPHLLRIFECGRAQIDGSEIIYIVTEMPEEALGQILPERPLTAAETGEMLAPVLDALAFLHGEGLVHGSLEPANILVVGEQLKLSPYTIQPAGLSIATERGAGLYDAPETELGPLTPAADLWSLGVTIVEALTQHRPSWVRDSGRDPLVPAAVPQPFAEIARRCLQFDPAQRCTLAEIRSLLTGAAAAPAPAFAAAAASAATAAQKPQQLPLAYETHEAMPAPGRPPLRKSLRALEDDEPRRPFPLAYLFGGAALLFLLIVGILAYSHRSKPTLAPPPDDSATADPAAREPKALPQPSGPTVKGEVAQRVTPEIPERAARGIRGKVEVRIKLAVDHSGNVMNASIVSDGRSRYFANLALESARKWRFHPAKIHGQAASSTWDLHWVFRPNGTEVTPTEITP
ncbi:TonB family protein [Occallatibacter riparius]|uniref:TonB family protein n=1 Tax=Occallatibacter riparius TaxID=1002689 RepID=A0A9J7BVY5_9BACT|nr:TonB family protein [Occallatibacter riparius]UWZ87028.1 TonB family protein [Occallatibacter riparius]